MRFEDTIKDRDIEEWIDMVWHRRIAFPIAKAAKAMSATPTQLTMVALVFGILGGISCGLALLYGPMLCLVGGVFILASVVFDCADGMLARMQGGGTRFGMLLDGMCDWIVGISFWVGISMATGQHMREWWAWPLFVFVLASAGFQATLYDSYKNAFVYGTTGAISDDKETTNDSGLARLMAGLYRTLYAAAQERVKKSRVEATHEVYRESLRGPMRSASWLGLGSGLFVLYAGAMLMPLWPYAPVVAGVVFLAVGRNILALYTLWTWRQATKKLRAASK